MRYTTVIDISEMPGVYRNHNARLIYLHMALKAGYHDVDRDVLDCSVRNLAAAAGITLSACRHALQVLEKAGLIKRQGGVYIIRKWLEEQAISSRPRTGRQQQQIEKAAAALQESEKRARELEIERTRREKMWATGKTSFMIFYEGLEKKAAAGDMEAAAQVARHRVTYEQHRAKVEQQQKNEPK